MTDHLIAAMYCFTTVPDPAGFAATIREYCQSSKIAGTVLVAEEGINGTVSGTADEIEGFVEFLRRFPGLKSLAPKYSRAKTAPFRRLRVRVKSEIVTMGQPDIDPRREVGTYVSPQDWNALLDDPRTVLVDTRNAYEVRVGTFEGALDPGLENFRQFPAWVRDNLDPGVHRKVAMFCTGGIRCEKATALLRREGFSEVYHLKGGILKYLEDMDPRDSRWRGECFVFDDRVAVDHSLAPGHHLMCFGCKKPLDPGDLDRPEYEASVCCHRCYDRVDPRTREARRERARQMALAAARGESHLGRSFDGVDPGE